MTTNLRPRVSFGLSGRSCNHWTPRYLYYRLRSILAHRLHPDGPWLTPAATRTLETLLRRTDRGAEWGSGSSTIWLAQRTAHLSSFETGPEYCAQVDDEIRRLGLSNVTIECIEFDDSTDEQQMHRSLWLERAHEFPDGSLDYALVDSSPRGCLCRALVPKIKSGGMLVLDNPDWFIRPPADIRPRTPSVVEHPLGTPGSVWPDHECWPAFMREITQWRQHWSSDGVQMTLILIRP